jgi:hypothetical protein
MTTNHDNTQMGPNPEEQRMHLINRMDGAQFKFLEVIESNQKAMEEGHVGSLHHLQERTFYYKKACDAMMAIDLELDIRYGGMSFDLRTAKRLIQDGDDSGGRLRRMIAQRLLKDYKTSTKLGDLSLPVLQGEDFDNVAVTFDLNKETTFSDINDCLLILQGPLSVSFHG